VLTLGISAINLVSILFYRYNLENQLTKEARLYFEVYKYNPAVRLPPYIKISDKLPTDKKYNILGITNGKYILLDNSFKSYRLQNFATTLIIWEAVLIFSLMLLMYFTIIKYIKKEEYIRKYLEILILTIAHKLGNFLSVQKLNIDLIKSKCRLKAVQRLEDAYSLIEKDFKFTIKTLKNLGEPEKSISTINLKDMIEDILHHFVENLSNKEVKLKLQNIYIKADSNDLENILFSVIENAVKFSENRIYIKMCKKDDNIYIYIKNDVGELSKGAGVGIQIAEFLLSQYGGQIKTHAGRDFLTVLIIPV